MTDSIETPESMAEEPRRYCNDGADGCCTSTDPRCIHNKAPEETRAEQLAERLMACATVDFDGDFTAAAVELRRLSAVEVDQSKRIAGLEAMLCDSEAQVARQAEPIQQAKEALETCFEHSSGARWYSGDAVHAALSAINEWEKSK